MSRIKVDDIQGTSGTESALNLSGKNLTAKGTFTVEGVHTLGTNAVATSDGNATTTSVIGGLSKAWISFRGTSTVSIRDSFNNASVTDNGSGDYGINFTNNMNNALYCVTYGGTHDGGTYWAVGTIDYDASNNGIATSAYTTNYMDNSNNVRDNDYCHETVFGDLA